MKLITHHNYKCMTCQHEFTTPIADSQYVRCPNCGSAWAEKQCDK